MITKVKKRQYMSSISFHTLNNTTKTSNYKYLKHQNASNYKFNPVNNS